jgi:hypothetical protein
MGNLRQCFILLLCLCCIMDLRYWFYVYNVWGTGDSVYVFVVYGDWQQCFSVYYVCGTGNSVSVFIMYVELVTVFLHL